MTTVDLLGKLFPAVPVPLTADGQIHRQGQSAYNAFLASRSIGGVAVWAHTGRGLRLTSAQRAEVLRSWREVLGPQRRVIAAAGAPPEARRPEQVLAHALEMAEQAATLGADALLVHPPSAFRDRPERDRLILEYHEAIARAGLPLILFLLYEKAGGIRYGPEPLRELLSLPQVLGIKVATLDSVMTFQDVARLVSEVAPDKVMISGEDRFLGYSLMCGARSALIGMGAACTELQAEFLRAFFENDASRFLDGNRSIDDLAQHTFLDPMEGYIQRMLWCLALQGVLPAEAAHDPWGPPLPEAQVSALHKCLERIGQLVP